MKAFVKGTAVALMIAASAFSTVRATEVRVMTSGGFTAAYKKLGPGFESATGNTLVTILGPSMGQSAEAIPNRLSRGESADVVIMVGYALDDLIKRGVVVPASRVELGDSRIAMAVKRGAPTPDISSVDAFRQTLLHAKSVAYSDSASGVYIEKEMFAKLGIEDQMKGKAKRIQRVPVGSVVASGDYEIGFQQVAELMPIQGITLVGRIPEPMQSVTRYAAGIPVNAPHPAEAKALLDYLSSPGVQPVVRSTGMDPVDGR
ncbi:substrate-binding domain-containing protein [Paraburkholderia sp.]|uniref:substrate-binding domain-containing protein n=1 Tax=Paraburkholderia sp. TaxID=1926495 RepID=UPI0023A54F21|nr:substrate-binding domain-containing protein [Paraburkholderia sp.]MDE1180474.1 substrate-binding domain-containing protein [Paraburkholderia sp.]